MHACMQRRKDQTNLVFHFMLMTHCFNREQLKKKNKRKPKSNGKSGRERERERGGLMQGKENIMKSKLL